MSKLDLNTRLKLKMEGLSIVDHLPVTKKRDFFSVNNTIKNTVFVFNDYEEYRNYYLMFIDEINDALIDCAIVVRGKNDEIVAYANAIHHIIEEELILNSQFRVNLKKEQVDDIHSRGKLTPMEKVREWEKMDLCAPGDAIGSAQNRCRSFSTCRECLVEYASHNDEYSPMDFKLVNSMSEDYVKRLIK